MYKWLPIVIATSMVVSGANRSDAVASDPYRAEAFLAMLDAGLHYVNFKEWAEDHYYPPVDPYANYKQPDPGYLSRDKVLRYAEEGAYWAREAFIAAWLAYEPDSKNKWAEAYWYHYYALMWRSELQDRSSLVDWDWMQDDIAAERALYAAWLHASGP